MSRLATSSSEARLRAAADRSDRDRRQLLARLHIVKAEKGLDDDTYRDLLERETGRRSAAELDTAQIAKVIDALTGTGVASIGRDFGVVATGPYAPKLKALWISGYHLGVVHNRTDAALIAFVRRMTGVDHTRFLQKAADANKAIEALKAWLAREAGVSWGVYGEGNDRLAIVWAQWTRLEALGQVKVLVPGEDIADALARFCARVTTKQALHFLTEADFDQVIRVLGAKLRKALAETRARETETAT